MADLHGSFSGIRDPAFQPGTAHQVPDPEAEVARLAFDRQVQAGQVCSAEDRRCDPDCESGPEHCQGHHAVRWKRTHDPDHCDRIWAAREASDG
jgi:hypothetical protein